MPPPDPTSHDALLVRCLVQVARGLIDAINTRDFSLSSSPWQHMSPNFMAEATGSLGKAMSLQECLEILNLLSAERAELKIEIVDMNTYVRKCTGHADIFINVKINSYEGLMVQDVGVLEFTCTDDTGWKCVRYRGMSGIGDLEGGNVQSVNEK